MTTFFRDTGERAVKTFCQSVLAVLIASGVTNVVDVDFGQAAGVGLLAALISVLTSLASGKWGGDLSPASAFSTPKKVDDQG